MISVCSKQVWAVNEPEQWRGCSPPRGPTLQTGSLTTTYKTQTHSQVARISCHYHIKKTNISHTCWVWWALLSHLVWWRHSIPGLFPDWRTRPLSETPPTGTYCVKEVVCVIIEQVKYAIRCEQTSRETQFATWSGPCYRKLAACRRRHAVHPQ